MAIRSGGGTGVLVALVVFVLTTVFLLVMTIVQFAGKNDAQEKMNAAEAELGAFIKPAQLQDDKAKALKTEAQTKSQSVYGFLTAQAADTAAWVSGNRGADLGVMQSELGITKDQTVKDVVQDLRRQLKAKTDESNTLNTRINDLTKQLTNAKDATEAARKDGDTKVEAVHTEVGEYTKAAGDYKKQVDDAVGQIGQVKTELENKHKSRVAELQTEIDSLRAERSVLDSRLAALEEKVKAIELKPQNPAELVDGRIIALEGSGDQVFINIGKKDRVVPGMTFEVFDDANAIQSSDRSGYSRGKASIQVLRVADATSTCKIVRSTTSRPVVKDDVIANAVFNPNYKYKFLVHGKFDVDGDGRPSESEAAYLKSRIVDWGGIVIDGDELTGDLDFLVLGMQPPMPSPLPPDATEAQIQANLEARTARETYDRLFKQATDARIPVLNANRFEVLTGVVGGR